MSDHPVSSSFIDVAGGSQFGSVLQQILQADDLQPGDEPSYQVCKALYLAHPLGAKMAEGLVKLAQSDEREISVPDSPEEAVVEEFKKQWKELHAQANIRSTKVLSRVYGIASLVMGCVGTPSDRPVSLKDLWDQDVFFNVLDPLNTSGFSVINQDPNSPGFLKPGDVMAQGQRYHRSRSVIAMNEDPIYIAWTSSAFGFAGRSVYQRALYPLKSFLQSMRTDDMVTRKAGVMVAKLQSPGSIIDRTMQYLYAKRRALIQQARTDNVISVGTTESIETLDMQNIDGAYGMARDNIIKNIATASGQPAKLLTQEAFVLGFGEGTEDSKQIAKAADDLRIEMQPLYDFMDTVCMYRAWNPEFYKTIQRKYPDEYGNKGYIQAFYEWKNSFKATWPSLLKEEPSEAAEVDDIHLKALIAIVQVLAPLLDPENKARLIQSVYDNLNTHEELFAGAQFDLDPEALLDFLEEQGDQQNMAMMGGGMGGGQGQENAGPAKPFSGQDSATVASLANFLASRPRDRLRALKERRRYK